MIAENRNNEVKIGDVLVATDRIWSKDRGSCIKAGHEMIINHLDDYITLPSPNLWTKKK